MIPIAGTSGKALVRTRCLPMTIALGCRIYALTPGRFIHGGYISDGRKHIHRCRSGMFHSNNPPPPLPCSRA